MSPAVLQGILAIMTVVEGIAARNEMTEEQKREYNEARNAIRKELIASLGE